MRAILLVLLVVAGCGPAPRLNTTPSPTVPPLIGVLNPAVTQSTIGSTICVAGWTAKIRPPAAYTTALKRRQMRTLNLPGVTSDYEEDHLMPLGLGGAPSDPANLRPVLTSVAYFDDIWERDLQRQVCSGRIDLAGARLQISEIKAELTNP
jgi:hypothetical protein